MNINPTVEFQKIYKLKVLYYAGLIKKIDQTNIDYDKTIKKYLESIVNYIHFKQINEKKTFITSKL